MRTLQRAIVAPEVGGEPLPPTFRCFQQNQIVLRRAEVTLIAGPPGSGKSSLALAIAVNLKQPTLYMSADTNAHTMAMRLISMTTGRTQLQSESLIEDEPEIATDICRDNTHLFWSFDSTPSLGDLSNEVLAFETQWGTSPTLIIIDNLMDVAMDGHEEFSGMREAMRELKYLARETNACVLILHHTKEGYEGHPCQPRSSVQGMVNQLPAMILTLGQETLGDTSYLCVSPVKNRYGAADPTGRKFVRLMFQPETMQLTDVVS